MFTGNLQIDYAPAGLAGLLLAGVGSAGWMRRKRRRCAIREANRGGEQTQTMLSLLPFCTMIPGA